MAGRDSSSSPPFVSGPGLSHAPETNLQGATAGTRKRKGQAATAAPKKARKPPKDYGTNEVYVFYGLRGKDIRYMTGRDLDCCNCNYKTGELPQPRSMSLVDLQCWIIKLFHLHPETQDLEIRAFFSANCPRNFYYSMLDRDEDWKMHYLTNDQIWASYVKKVKRKNGMPMFVLYVDCSEIKHYESLFKVYNEAQSQVAMGANVRCNLTQVLPEQNSLSCDWHAIRILDNLKKNLTMTTTEIVAYLAEEYGVQISRAGAWRVKQKALELEFGTFYDSYNYVSRLFTEIRYGYINHLPFVDTKYTEVAGCEDFRILHSIFWAFAQCIQAFVSCRPVLCIKSMPLCGKYQGALLTSIALDANDTYIPVAFAVVESESTENWLWFLRNVKRVVVKQRRHVCIIHDYKRELLDAIDDLQNNQQEEHAWRDVKSRWCMQHLAENFLAHFGDEKLMTLFKKLCQQNQQSKFVKIWKELDELILKHASEKEGASAEAHQESVERDMTGLEAQGPINRDYSVLDVEEVNYSSDTNGNRRVFSFSEWIRPKSMEKWSLLHDTFGARYGVMGINMADLNNNHVLKGINCLPLAAMVDMTLQRMVEYFNNNSVAAKKAMGNPSVNFPECVQGFMDSKMRKSQKHQVVCMTTEDRNCYLKEVDKMFKVQLKQKHVIVQLKSIHTRSMDKAHEFNNNNKSFQLPTSWCKIQMKPKESECTVQKIVKCSCNKPQLHHKPCSHVIAVCCHVGVSIATYMSPYYSLTNLVGTWNGTFNKPNTFKDYYSRYKALVPWEMVPWISTAKPTWIPNKNLECGLSTLQTSDIIHTESGAVAHDQSSEDCLGAPSQA